MKPSVSLATSQAFRTGIALAFCFNRDMTPKELMIQRLKALCAEHGVDVVADEANISADNLRQIIAGTKLESGAPRGVGPMLQRKLEAKYPGWVEPATTDALDPRAAMVVADMLQKAPREDLDVWLATFERDLHRSSGAYSPEDLARFKAALRALGQAGKPLN